MPQLIESPTTIPVAANKIVEEFVGRVNTKTTDVSIARMKSPPGWSEPGQRPEFDEYTIVLAGTLKVEHEDGVTHVRSGQAVLARRGEWVRYSTPDGAEYVAICTPAFSVETVHRDAQ